MRVKISYSVDVDLDVYRARHHADTPSQPATEIAHDVRWLAATVFAHAMEKAQPSSYVTGYHVQEWDDECDEVVA